VSWGEGPHEPSAFLAGIGKGRFLSKGPFAVLERRDARGWTEVARYRSVRDANMALDSAVAGGGRPDSLRVVERHAASNGVLLIAGAVAVGAAIAIVLYVVFG